VLERTAERDARAAELAKAHVRSLEEVRTGEGGGGVKVHL
jgi:hypothetical protein